MAITPFSLTDNFNMQEFNSRIGEMNSNITAKGTTAGTGDALTLSLPNFNLVDGATVSFKTHDVANSGATLNINSTGDKPIKNSNGSDFSGAIAGSWITVVYSGALDSFILQGEGGGSSTKRYQSRTFEALMGYTALHSQRPI